MTPQDRDLTINMSGISVSGVGGLGLVAVAGLIIYTFQQAWWLFVCGAVGGFVLGCSLIVFRRHHTSSGPSGDDPTILFRAAAPVADRPVVRARTLELRTLER